MSVDFDDLLRGSGSRGGGRRAGGRRPLDAAKVLAWIAVGAILLVAFLMVATGQGGIVEIQDDQAAVIVNFLSGRSEVVTTPGYQIFFPFIQQAFLFDKSPQEFLMQGDVNEEPNVIRKLTVRANDGSNFWFDEVKIQYEIIPSEAEKVLADSGPGEEFKRNWVRAYARSILRDEFGKFSAVEVADATTYRAATRASEERLNDELAAFGLRILQIPPPKPTFEVRYEKAIEDRKVADQNVERLKTQATQLEQERERRLAEIESSRAVEFEALKGELEAQRIAAEQERIRIERTADAYLTQRLGEGQAILAQLTEEARGLTEKARKEAEGLTAITAALETGGEVLVRERLAELLTQVEFRLMPYSRDPRPTRIELLEGGDEGDDR